MLSDLLLTVIRRPLVRELRHLMQKPVDIDAAVGGGMALQFVYGHALSYMHRFGLLKHA